MDSDDPLTEWLDELRNAEPMAAQKLWGHFCSGLLVFARHRLRPETRRVYDEEDAVQSAFVSFCTGIELGRFPDLHDREGLWRLLISLTARKVAHRHRFDGQLCRNVLRTASDACFSLSSDHAEFKEHPGFVSREPSPEFAAEFMDVLEDLTLRLKDSSLHAVLALRMEGHTETEIAEKLNCSRSTVQRRFEIIRRHWEDMEGSLDQPI
jgi:DNA-directed RNA polymerase specialized sigma24 family protein